MATSGRDEKAKSYVVDEKTAEEFLDAALAGNVGRVEELLAANPGLVRATDSDGWTAVYRAAYRGHTAVVRQLLAAAPELLQAETKRGSQLAHTAAVRGHADMLAVLIELGARVDAQTKAGETPLHQAAGCGSEACVRVLLAKGARVDAQTKAGDTPLHRAAAFDRAACVRVLLAAGARVDVRNNSGQTARDVAEEEGYSNIVALLEAHEKSQQTVPSASVSQAAGNAAAQEDSAATSVTTAAVAQNPTHNPAAQDQHMDSENTMISTDTAPSNEDMSSQLSRAPIVDTATANEELATAMSRVSVTDAEAADLQEHTPMGKTTRGLHMKEAKKRPLQWTEPQPPNRAGASQARLRLLCEQCELLTDDYASHLVREHGADRSEAERAEQHEREQAVTTYNKNRVVDAVWLENEMHGLFLSYNDLVRILRQLGHHVTGHRRYSQGHTEHRERSPSSHSMPQRKTSEAGSTNTATQAGSINTTTQAGSINTATQAGSIDTATQAGSINTTAQAGSINTDQSDSCGRTAASGCHHRKPDTFSFTIPYTEWKDNVKGPITKSYKTYYTNVSNVLLKYFSSHCDCSVVLQSNFYSKTTPNFKAIIEHKKHATECKNTRYLATVNKLDENLPLVFNVERIGRPR